MSFNIRYGTARDGDNRWERRREMLLDLLRTERPDVLGVQEALRFQLDEIGAAALPEYVEIGVGRDDGRTAGEYSALLISTRRFAVADSGTFWFSDTPTVPGSRSWGNTIPRICTWARLIEKPTGRAFYVYNVHLDHQSQPSRERSVQLLTERIAARSFPDPFLILGDFNVGEKNPALRPLTGGAAPVAADTFRVLHPTETGVGTFNGFRGTTTGQKIDYILASPGWQVRDAQIVRFQREGRYPSDHFPVTARLRLPAPAADAAMPQR